MQISNGLPRLLIPCGLAGHQTPFFAGLPINHRELIGVSTRLTFAKSCIFLLIATPLGYFYLRVLDFDGDPLLALVLIPAIAMAWTLSRPVFIYHRLRSAVTRRIGTLLISYMLNALAIGLTFIWTISGIAICVSAYSFSEFRIADPTDRIVSVSILLGSLLVNAVSARMIFEVFSFRLRRNHLDWVIKTENYS
ncbi:hypothetical protein ACFSSA_11400 [Luteolibacter algae]|uniref:Uncharacterized protein n=1 Tax=Luteolibacter algae TaxID=454151 RepID=A0ABW5DB42_9BACT